MSNEGNTRFTIPGKTKESEAIMVLLIIMPWRVEKLVIKCPRKLREHLWKSRGPFTNPSNAWGDILSIISQHVMVLVCNTMIDDKIWLVLFWILREVDVCSWMLMRGKWEICPVRGENEINQHFTPYNLHFFAYSLLFMLSPVCCLQIILTDCTSSDIAIFIETGFRPLDPYEMCAIIFFQIY